jgi:hypothetical protein
MKTHPGFVEPLLKLLVIMMVERKVDMVICTPRPRGSRSRPVNEVVTTRDILLN